MAELAEMAGLPVMPVGPRAQGGAAGGGMEIDGFAAFAERLRVDGGYVDGPPNEASAEVDGQVAWRYRCACCGGRLAYAPMTSYVGGTSGGTSGATTGGAGTRFSYRAFAVCRVCDKADEF